MGKTNSEHVKKMLECTLGNVEFYDELKKACLDMIDKRGGKATVTLKQAEEIDIEVSLLAGEFLNEES